LRRALSSAASRSRSRASRSAAQRAWPACAGSPAEDEHEVQLNAERPVVTKETVPVERVRLATESVASEEQVSEKARKEQIDELEVDTRRGREC
jgi:stress response protein YsnF